MLITLVLIGTIWTVSFSSEFIKYQVFAFCSSLGNQGHGFQVKCFVVSEGSEKTQQYRQNLIKVFWLFASFLFYNGKKKISRCDSNPFRSSLPVRAGSRQKRETDTMIKCSARSSCPFKDPPSGIRCLPWALRSTRHLPGGFPGLRDTSTRKSARVEQLLSELGSKSPSALQKKNIFQAGLLSPWFKWMLNESLGTTVVVLGRELSEILCRESSVPFRAFYY